MPESESPQVRRDRLSAVVAASLVCLATPTVTLLVYDIQGDNATRRVPLFWLLGAAIVGAVIPFLYWSPYRALGLVVIGTLGWLAAAAHGVFWRHWPGWAHGLPLGLIAGALARGRRGPGEWRKTTRSSGRCSSARTAWGLSSRAAVHAGRVLRARDRSWSTGLLLHAPLPPSSSLVSTDSVGPLAVGARSGLADFPRTGPCLISPTMRAGSIRSSSRKYFRDRSRR